MRHYRSVFTSALLIASLMLAGMVPYPRAASGSVDGPHTPPVPATISQVFLPLGASPQAPLSQNPAPPVDDATRVREQKLAEARRMARLYAGEELHTPSASLINEGDGAYVHYPTIGVETLQQNYFAPLLPGVPFVRVDVDLKTMARVDGEALLKAEWEAYRAKYGKLDIPVYDWLQTAAPTSTMDVGIWILQVQPNDAMTLATNRVLALYPEAQAAVDAGRSYWDVGDPVLEAEIRAAFLRFLDEELAIAVAPALMWLLAQGVDAHAFGGLPCVGGQLTPAQIRAVQELDSVVFIQWVGAPVEPA